MQITRLQMKGLLAVAQLVAATAYADIGLRVESRPITAPIDAYVRVTDGSGPVAGLTPADFVVAIDGVPVERFTLVLPPRQDSTQQLSIVIVMNDQYGHPSSDYSQLIDQLAPGDFVSIIKYWGDIEAPRRGGMAVLPFTEIDGGPGSDEVTQFIEEDSPFTQPGFPHFLFDGVMRGLAEFERASATLPEGPKAIVTVDCCGGRQSLSEVVASANAASIPIFKASDAAWNRYPDVIAHLRALASSTGGRHVTITRLAPMGDAIATMASWLKDGYRLTIPRSAAANCRYHYLEVTVRGESTRSRFNRCDTTPERFDFADLPNAAVATQVTSNAVTITGIESSVPVTVYDGEYSVGCGSTFTSAPGRIRPGESVCVRHTTAATGGLEVETLLIVGAVSGWFVSSTVFAE